MNNLKEQYFFIIDFFLPENENFHLKEFKIISEKNYLNFVDYFIYPVEYAGFFNTSCYLLLNREDFLFRDKQIFINTIHDNFLDGAKNIYSLNFKNLGIKIGSYIDEFDFSDNYLLLNYELIKNNTYYTFGVIITTEFLNSFIKGLLNERGKRKKWTISDFLSYIKLRLYRDSITSFWDLRNFLKELSNKDTQMLLNLLLKNNIIEETMLTGFIAGFKDSKIMTKLVNNLSQNLKDDIQKNLALILSDLRWIQESTYLIRTGIEKLIFENQLTIANLKYIQEIKDRIKKEKYLKVFQDKSYEDYLNDAYKDQLIEKIKLRIDRKTILISLKNCKEKIVKYFLDTLSSNAQQEFKDDLLHYQDKIKEEEIFKSRIKIVEVLKDLIYEKKAEDTLVFKPIILDLNTLNLNLLIEEAGVIKFAQATINEKKDLKKHIIFSARGVVRLLFFDIYSGKVRFKSGFGEATIKAIKKEILKIYYFLKDTGKMI